jgi:hypothetical protein
MIAFHFASKRDCESPYYGLLFTYDFHQEIRQYCNTLADGRLEASSVQIDPRCDYKASPRQRNLRHNNYNIDFLCSFSVTNPQNVTTSPPPPPKSITHTPEPNASLLRKMKRLRVCLYKGVHPFPALRTSDMMVGGGLQLNQTKRLSGGSPLPARDTL